MTRRVQFALCLTVLFFGVACSSDVPTADVSSPDGQGDVSATPDDKGDTSAGDSTTDAGDSTTDAGDDATVPGLTDNGSEVSGDVVFWAPDTSASWDAPYSVVTWNVGLAYGYVPLADERREHILDALKDLDDHVICLQEVWRVEDQEAVRAVLEESGYTVHIYQTVGGQGGCTDEEVAPMLACVEENNCEDDPDDLVTCVTTHCAEELAGLSSGCLGCLTVDLTRTIGQMMTNCIENDDANAFAFGGHNGLVLASKDPGTQFTQGDFEASLTWRSYISAQIPKLEGCDPPLDIVVCTHLTSDLSNVPYTGTFGSYAAENAQQIDQMLAEIPQDEHVIIMGDFNTGPDSTLGNTSAELSENFAKLTDAGWISAFLGDCTWCPDENDLLNDGAPDHVIDHVMLNTPVQGKASWIGTRIMDDGLGVPGPDNSVLDAHLSDHFGVRVTFDKAVEAP
jgi:endonuclease/exonuclease/phosphatase family metal-dependent hydrolase